MSSADPGLEHALAEAYLRLRSVTPVGESDPATTSPSPQNLVADVIRWLWLTTGAETLDDALADIRFIERAPVEILEKWRALRTFSLASAIDLPLASEHHWRAFLDLSDREERILRARIACNSSSRITLEALGSELVLTRERVRQLEKTLRTRLWDVRPEPNAAVHHLAASLRRRLGDVTTGPMAVSGATEFVEDSSEIPTKDLDLRVEILLSLTGPWNETDDFLLSAHADDSIHATKKALSEIGADEPADGLITELLLTLRLTDDRRDDILTLVGVRQIEGHYFKWGRTQPEKAMALLAARGQPMEMVEIHEGVGLEASPRSLSQRLQSDERFMRRGKDTYGLRKWGGEEYSGIIEELQQAIERAGGSAPLDELVDRFVEQFDVSASSVRSFANHRQFIRRTDGTLAMRGAADPDVVVRYDPIEETTGVFLLDDIWHLRVEVNADILRGSGAPLRQSAAAVAGIEPDLSVGFVFDGPTEVLFSWRGNYPTIGSVRGIAAHHQCGEGDLLFLPLAGHEPRSCKLIPGTERFAAIGIRRLGAEVGVHPTDLVPDATDPPPRIRAALGLSAGSDWHDLVDRLRDRREEDLLKHIPTKWR